MNSNELRVGNYVYLFSHIKELLAEDLGDIFSSGNYKDIEPIPLTSKILKKCGFESESIHIGAVITGETMLIHSKAIMETYVKRIGMRPKYLHQLQNLYFALTGQELIVNL